MITFNELTLSDDRKTMTIDVEIPDTTAYQDYHIQGIWVEYYKNRLATGAPSNKAYCAFEADPLNPLTSKRLTVNATSMGNNTASPDSFAQGMFYVIVICTDGFGEDPDVVSDVACIPDMQAVYEEGMNFVSSLNSACKAGQCEFPVAFENFVIVFHALNLALEAHDMDMMDRLWDRFISFGGTGFGTSTCNCG